MARPKKEIDWNKVEELMEVNSPASEIMDQFDISSDTFYIRFKDYYSCSFQDYKAKFHSVGKGNLRRTQYEKALEGNTNMLILLGKLWLGQVDIEPEPKKTDDFNAQNEIMQLKNTVESMSEILKQNNIEFNVQDKPEAE